MDVTIMLILAGLSILLLGLAYKGSMSEEELEQEINPSSRSHIKVNHVPHSSAKKETDVTFCCPTCQRTYRINVARFTCACGEVFCKKEAYLTDEDKVSPFLMTYTELLATLAKIDGDDFSHVTQTFARLLKELEVNEVEYRICLAAFDSHCKTMYKKTTLLNLESYNVDQGFKSFLLYSCLKIIFANGHPSDQQLTIMDDIVEVFNISDALCDELIRDAIETLDAKKIASSYALTHYELLNVTPGCSARELKQSYRQLMKLYHPDKFEGTNLPLEIKQELSRKVIEIQTAYERIKQEEGLTGT